MNSMHVILGNQLFPIKYIKQIKPEIVFMKEDYGLCTYEKHHKHKIILFLSAMRSYRDELKKNNINMHYEELSDNTDTYKESLIKFIQSKRVKNVSFWLIEDKWFKEEIWSIGKHVHEIKELKSPMFLTDREDFLDMCPTRKSPKYKMTDFYINQRKKMDILMTAGKPAGGKWTYDDQNRKKIPKS